MYLQTEAVGSPRYDEDVPAVLVGLTTGLVKNNDRLKVVVEAEA